MEMKRVAEMRAAVQGSSWNHLIAADHDGDVADGGAAASTICYAAAAAVVAAAAADDDDDDDALDRRFDDVAQLLRPGAWHQSCQS